MYLFIFICNEIIQNETQNKHNFVVLSVFKIKASSDYFISKIVSAFEKNGVFISCSTPTPSVKQGKNNSTCLLLLLYYYHKCNLK